MTDLIPGHCLWIFPCWGMGCVVLAAEPQDKRGLGTSKLSTTLSFTLPPGCCALSLVIEWSEGVSLGHLLVSCYCTVRGSTAEGQMSLPHPQVPQGWLRAQSVPCVLG